MTDIRLRPTFSFATDLNSAEVFETLSRTTKQTEHIQGRFTTYHATLFFDDSKRHFWSPWLHVEVRELDSQKELFCRFSPHPSIWTAFMFTYLSLGVLTFFSAVMGVSQQIAQEAGWAWWLIPVWLVIGLSFWIASQVGQRLANEQMHVLKAFVEATLKAT